MDPFPHTGDAIRGVLMFKQELNIDIRIHTFSANESEKDWLDESVRTWMQEQFLAANIKLSDAQPLSEEAPPELLENEVAKPDLMICVRDPENKNQGIPSVDIPNSLKDKYLKHASPEIR